MLESILLRRGVWGLGYREEFGLAGSEFRSCRVYVVVRCRGAGGLGFIVCRVYWVEDECLVRRLSH